MKKAINQSPRISVLFILTENLWPQRMVAAIIAKPKPRRRRTREVQREKKFARRLRFLFEFFSMRTPVPVTWQLSKLAPAIILSFCLPHSPTVFFVVSFGVVVRCKECLFWNLAHLILFAVRVVHLFCPRLHNISTIIYKLVYLVSSFNVKRAQSSNLVIYLFSSFYFHFFILLKLTHDGHGHGQKRNNRKTTVVVSATVHWIFGSRQYTHTQTHTRKYVHYAEFLHLLMMCANFYCHPLS